MGLAPEGVYAPEQKRPKLYSDFTVEPTPLPPSKIDLLVEQSVSYLMPVCYHLIKLSFLGNKV
jgi:hypothetical protein